MTRVLVLYYSGYGHIHEMAEAAAAGAAQIPGTEVALKRVPETIPEEVRRRAGYRDFVTPLATVAELEDYDAIILGTPTRFGNMAAQMKQFIDQAGGLWARNALVGKVGSVFTSTASQHGGHEAAILATQIPLLHLGMVVVGLPYSFAGQTRVDRITGGSPYGAGTVAGAEGELRPTDTDLEGARFQGRHVAGIAVRLGAQTPELVEA